MEAKKVNRRKYMNNIIVLSQKHCILNYNGIIGILFPMI